MIFKCFDGNDFNTFINWRLFNAFYFLVIAQNVSKEYSDLTAESVNSRAYANYY